MFRESFDINEPILNADKNVTFERPGSFSMHVIYNNSDSKLNGTNQTKPNVSSKTGRNDTLPEQDFNMNLREDDVYSLVIVTQDIIAKAARSQLAKGIRLSDVDVEVLKAVKRDLFQYYVFSSKLSGYAYGTKHYSSIWPEEVKTKAEKLNKEEKDQKENNQMQLDAHGINEHVIVLSLNELVKHQMPLRWLISKSIKIVDPSVIVIN